MAVVVGPVVSVDGAIGAISRQPVKLGSTSPPFAEADCDQIWHTVAETIHRTRDLHGHGPLEAIGISSILGYVLLDRHDAPIAPAILYADNRAVTEAREMVKVVPAREIHRLTGRRATPEALAAKLLWLKQHRPVLMRRLAKVIGLKDEMVRRL